MNSLEKLKTTAAIVRDIMERYPATRNDDDFLYAMVCRKCKPECVNMTFFVVMNSRKVMGLPPFESVRRSRQKIQREFPHLASTERTKQARTKNEAEYRSFAKLKGDVEQWLK